MSKTPTQSATAALPFGTAGQTIIDKVKAIATPKRVEAVYETAPAVSEDLNAKRPLVKLPAPFNCEVYADSAEYQNWLAVKAVRDWVKAFSGDLERGLLTGDKAVQRISAFLADDTISGAHKAGNLTDTLGYLRAGYGGAAEITVGQHLMALRRHGEALDSTLTVASNLPSPSNVAFPLKSNLLKYNGQPKAAT